MTEAPETTPSSDRLDIPVTGLTTLSIRWLNNHWNVTTQTKDLSDVCSRNQLLKNEGQRIEQFMLALQEQLDSRNIKYITESTNHHFRERRRNKESVEDACMVSPVTTDRRKYRIETKEFPHIKNFRVESDEGEAQEMTLIKIADSVNAVVEHHEKTRHYHGLKNASSRYKHEL